MADLRQSVEAELENIDAVISALPPAGDGRNFKTALFSISVLGDEMEESTHGYSSRR